MSNFLELETNYGTRRNKNYCQRNYKYNVSVYFTYLNYVKIGKKIYNKMIIGDTLILEFFLMMFSTGIIVGIVYYIFLKYDK